MISKTMHAAQPRNHTVTNATTTDAGRKHSRPRARTRYELLLTVIRALADPSNKSCSEMRSVLQRSDLSEDDRRRASESIDDLVVAIAEREAHLIAEPLAISGHPHSMEQVQRSLMEFGRVAWREYSTVLVGFVRMVMTESACHPALRKKIYEAGPAFVTLQLREYLAEANARGIISISNAELCAEQLMGMLREPLYKALMLSPVHDGVPEEQVQTCVQRFLKGCDTARSCMP